VVPLLVAAALLHERRVGPEGRGLLRNQRIVYRERWSPELGRRLLWSWARHLARLAVDIARIPRLDAERARACIDPEDLGALRGLAAEGRGLICVSGHIGVWELCSQIPSALGVPVTVIARPVASAALEALLRGLRERGGQRVLDKRGALWRLTRTLWRGGVIGLLVDEDAPTRPIFAPFLGTLAATHPTAAFLQRVSGAPIAVVTCPRVGPGSFRLRCWRVIRHAPSGDPEADLQAVTEAVNEALSRAILAYPEQWLWGSRRFSTRPPGECMLADGLPPRATPSDSAAALG
jgi:KDO2-lipid IV(A) lauroyltransferase